MERRTGTRSAPRLALRRFHRSGVAPVRVLLVGDRAQLLGSGDDSGTQAERVADRIWLTTRRGVDLDVLGDLAPVLRAIAGTFRSWRLWRYDVVVVVLGDGLDAHARPRTLHRTVELLKAVLEDAPDTEVLIVGGARQADRSGAGAEQRLEQAVQALAADRVRLSGTAASADPEERERAWAGMVGAAVARSVVDAESAGGAPAPLARALPEEEEARQRALDELGVVGRPPDPRLDDLVELARTAFGTESAEISFLDRDRRWKMATAGSPRIEVDRAGSFCDLTIRSGAPLVVGDAQQDPVLRTSPLAHGPHPVRFYAAHPIESADGHRIGSFCVYDSEPRDVRGLDIALLRDLALLAQAELDARDVPPAEAVSRIRGG